MEKFSDLKKEFNIRPDILSDELPDDAMVELHSKVSRQAGTGYYDYIYSINGNKNDAIVIHTNRVDHGTLYNSCEYEKDFFAKRQSYAKQVGDLSKKYNIPFDVGLALGTKEEVYRELSNILPNLKSNINVLDTEDIINDLYCGINRRKNAIRTLIGDDLSGEISLNFMGQTNSSRIGNFLRDVLEEKIVYKAPSRPLSSLIKNNTRNNDAPNLDTPEQDEQQLF